MTSKGNKIKFNLFQVMLLSIINFEVGIWVKIGRFVNQKLEEKRHSRDIYLKPFFGRVFNQMPKLKDLGGSKV